MRGNAKSLLKHYSGLAEIEMAHKAFPDKYGPVPPFSHIHRKTAITELGLDTICQEDSEH